MPQEFGCTGCIWNKLVSAGHWRPDPAFSSQSCRRLTAHTHPGAVLGLQKQNFNICASKISPDDYFTTGRWLINGIRWLLHRLVSRERGVSIEEVVGLGDQVFSVCLDVFPASVYLWDCFQLVYATLEALLRFLILVMGLWKTTFLIKSEELFPRWHTVGTQTLEWVSTFCWKNKVKKLLFSFFPPQKLFPFF